MYRTKHLFLFLCIVFVVGVVGIFVYMIPYGIGNQAGDASAEAIFTEPQERYALYTKPENVPASDRTAFLSKVRGSLDADMPKKNISDTEIVVLKDEPVQVFETTPVVVPVVPVIEEIPSEVTPPVASGTPEVYEIIATSSATSTTDISPATTTVEE